MDQSTPWPLYSFGHLINMGILFVSDGYRAKNEELGGNGPIFLRAGHLSDSYIDFTGTERFNSCLTPKVAPKMSRASDVIITTKGNSTGRVSFVTDTLPPIISLPPAHNQKFIEESLTCLDDKIELNRLMNQTLETTARAIFKSWFVDFEATQDQTPHHEIATVQDLAQVSRELINPSNCPDTLLDHYSIPAFDAGKTPHRERGSAIRSTKFSVPPGAVLLSKLNPRIPRVWLPSIDPSLMSICSTEFLVVSPRGSRSIKEFLYSLFCSSEFMEQFASRTTGTSGSHQRVRAEDLLRFEIPIPTKDACEQYSITVRPVLEKAGRNLEESRTLANLRDTLLPKLLSGEIRVKQAEKIVESAL